MPHPGPSKLEISQYELPIELGTLSFIQDLEKYKHERPYRWAAPLIRSMEHMRTNIKLRSKPDLAFRDMRSTIGNEEKLSLKRDGFQILQRPPDAPDPVMGDNEALKDYLTDLASGLKALLSAEAVYCVNFVFRQCRQGDLADPDETFVKSATPTTAVKPDVPAFPAHADFTRSYGQNVIHESLTEAEAVRYLNVDHHVWLVNAWKPLYRSVQNAPLAFCDPTTISQDDVLEVDIASPSRVSGATYLKHNAKQQWYWCSDQQPNEISLFKSWDSDEMSTVPYVPHCAVRLKKFDSDEHRAPIHDDIVLRDSIEARMVVIMKKGQR